MRKIAAVTFDLWDTLVQEYPGGADKVAGLRVSKIGSILAERGMTHSSDEIMAAYRKTGYFLELTWSKKRDMPVRDQVLFMLSSIDDKLLGKLNRDGLEQIEKAYIEGILDNPPMLLPGAKEALGTVRSKGYKIGLISNTGRTPGIVLRKVMENLGILEYFDTTTFSNETLVRKPAESAFRATLDKLKVAPKSAVHVGDDAEGDIAGAKRAGMRAIQIVAPGARKSNLADDYARTLDEIADKLERL